MPDVKCKICNTEFYIKPYHYNKGWGKYCSKKCQYEGQKKGNYKICEICSKETWKAPRTLKKSQSGKFFCGKKCQTVWRNKRYKGELHANWKGGEFTYQRIMKENNITPICTKCKISDKRILIIHHKDQSRKHNDIDNLIWLCRNCHYLIHNHDEVI